LICLNAGQPALLPQCRVYGEGVVHEEVRIFLDACRRKLAVRNARPGEHRYGPGHLRRVSGAFCGATKNLNEIDIRYVKRNAKVVGNYCKTHKSDTVMNAMQKNWR
jgi:hypothetical protein